MTTKMKILIGILVVVILISVFCVIATYSAGKMTCWCGIFCTGRPVVIPKQVTVTTDKTEYEQGETVKIMVRNGLDKSIWYIKEECDPSCCGLYEWKNDKWEFVENPMPCIQFTGPHVKKPDELKLNEEIRRQWDMKVWGGEFAEGGRYKFSFHYGLTKNSYRENTIYSNEFTIKEVCIDSNEQCKEKPDGTECNYGVWCDEQGRICGGQSCVGLGMGTCLKEKCLPVDQQIIDRCKEEEKFVGEVQSDPDCLKGEEFICVDGWENVYYYDKSLVTTKQFPQTFFDRMPKEMREKLEKATIAKYHSSSCYCKKPISYEILVKDELKETTCEGFYKFIEDYDSSCGECILTWSEGCC